MVYLYISSENVLLGTHSAICVNHPPFSAAVALHISIPTFWNTGVHHQTDRAGCLSLRRDLRGMDIGLQRVLSQHVHANIPFTLGR